MTGSNPLQIEANLAQRDDLTDKKGIPLSAVITSAASTLTKVVTKMSLIMQLSKDLRSSYLQ